ncbi:SPARC-like isoform X2 [Haliotis rufescens]|uniref:SPARC-like isoform X2 n=2 Tax=Haliotis rufescens TaxID=6454 RepID=UPI001EAFE0FD|nr:SPARC-like isoform X2 [Haliotis rufescens]
MELLRWAFVSRGMFSLFTCCTMRHLLLVALLAVIFSAVFAKVEEGGEEESDEDEKVDVYAEEKRLRMRIDLCKKKKCYRGEVCRLDNRQQAECVCLHECEPEVDPRYHVCSTKNQTYESECELDRDHCLCKTKQPGCSNARLNKIQLDYFGGCRKLTKCPDDEFEEFPIRMKEWLFLVMKQLASRDELGEYIDLLDKARNDANHTEAVLWKFCDLDSSPQDRQVSRRELQYIVQSLKAWEHCLVPFLSMCDQDSNRKITLTEWGACLGVNSKKISDKCIDIRARAKRH